MNKYIIHFPISLYYFLLGDYFFHFKDIKEFVEKNHKNPTKLVIKVNEDLTEQNSNFFKLQLINKINEINDIELKQQIQNSIITNYNLLCCNTDDTGLIFCDIIDLNLKNIDLNNIEKFKIHALNFNLKICENLRSKFLNLKTISIEDSIGCSCCSTYLNIDESHENFKTFFKTENIKMNYVVMQKIPIIETNYIVKKLYLNEIRRFRGTSGGFGHGGGKYLDEYKFLYNLRTNIINFTNFINLIEINFTNIHFGIDGRFLKALTNNCKNIKIINLDLNDWGTHDDVEETEQNMEFINNLDEEDLCINNGLKYLLQNSNVEHIKLLGYLWSRIDYLHLLKPDDFKHINNKPLKNLKIHAMYNANEFNSRGHRIKMKYGYGKQIPIQKMSNETTILGLSLEDSKKIFPYLDIYEIGGIPTLKN